MAECRPQRLDAGSNDRDTRFSTGICVVVSFFPSVRIPRRGTPGRARHGAQRTPNRRAPAHDAPPPPPVRNQPGCGLCLVCHTCAGSQARCVPGRYRHAHRFSILRTLGSANMSRRVRPAENSLKAGYFPRSNCCSGIRTERRPPDTLPGSVSGTRVCRRLRWVTWPRGMRFSGWLRMLALSGSWLGSYNEVRRASGLIKST